VEEHRYVYGQDVLIAVDTASAVAEGIPPTVVTRDRRRLTRQDVLVGCAVTSTTSTVALLLRDVFVG
jgi:hypothetical protein